MNTLNLIEEFIGLPVTSKIVFDTGKSSLSPQKLNSSYSKELSILSSLIARISSISTHSRESHNV